MATSKNEISQDIIKKLEEEFKLVTVADVLTYIETGKLKDLLLKIDNFTARSVLSGDFKAKEDYSDSEGDTHTINVDEIFLIKQSLYIIGLLLQNQINTETDDSKKKTLETLLALLAQKDKVLSLSAKQTVIGLAPVAIGAGLLIASIPLMVLLIPKGAALALAMSLVALFTALITCGFLALGLLSKFNSENKNKHDTEIKDTIVESKLQTYGEKNIYAIFAPESESKTLTPGNDPAMDMTNDTTLKQMS